VPVNIEFEVTGDEAWVAALRWKQTNVVDEIQDTFMLYGQKVTDSAQKYVRSNAYDTGSLHRSIDWKTQEGRSFIKLEVGPMKDALDRSSGDKEATDYAHWVHDGTSRMAPRPFMDVAWKKHEKRLMRKMRKIAQTIDRVR